MGRLTRAGLRSCSIAGGAALLLLALTSPAAVSSGRPASMTGAATPSAVLTSTAVPAAVASKLEPWHLAPALEKLRTEVNARWPGRSRASDGAIGDARHSKSRNSHNPVGTMRGPEHGTPGAVHALDITAAGIDTAVLLEALIGDARLWYVIFDGRIWSRTVGWAARDHSGDPHSTHLHVSLRDGSERTARAAEKDTSRWLTPRSAAKAARTKRLSTKTTKALQKALIRHGYRIPSGPTGWYGPETTKAVRAFQRDQGWSGSGADGIAGSMTLKRLGVGSGSGAAKAKAAAKRAAAKAKAAKAKAKKAKAKKKAAAKKASAKKKAKAKSKAAKAKAKKDKAAKAKTKDAAASGAYQPGTATREVYFMQEALIERGYSIPAGPTGYYGVKTVAAVKAFQRAQGWRGKQADGVAGKATLKRLGLL